MGEQPRRRARAARARRPSRPRSGAPPARSARRCTREPRLRRVELRGRPVQHDRELARRACETRARGASRAYSSCASTRSASAASRSSWRAVNVSEVVSSHTSVAGRSLLSHRELRRMALDLVRLLERRPVDPVDQRLRGAADRALADGVEAPLVAGRSADLGRRRRACVAGTVSAAASERAQRARGSARATRRRSTRASSGPRTLRPSTVRRSLRDVAVPASPGRRSRGAAPSLLGALSIADRRRSARRTRLRRAPGSNSACTQQRPPRVHDPDRVGVLVDAVAGSASRRSPPAFAPRAQLRDRARAAPGRAGARSRAAPAAGRRARAGRSMPASSIASISLRQRRACARPRSPPSTPVLEQHRAVRRRVRVRRRRTR